MITFFRKITPGEKRNPNLTHQEIKALNKLKNQDIIIKPANKGSKIVIMDKTQYLIEASKQLHNPLHYKSLPESLQKETRDITPIINKLYKDKYFLLFPPCLLRPNSLQPHQFYLLPKIHKDPTL